LEFCLHNKCIKKISKETETKINQSKDDIHFPYGIAALDDGNLVVSDMIYERMSIIKSTGEMALQFGHYGNTNSTFNNPSECRLLIGLFLFLFPWIFF
jgi:hypothetical protein